MKPTVVTEDLWRELHDGLFAFIRRRVDSDPDAEDILQEIETDSTQASGVINDAG